MPLRGSGAFFRVQSGIDVRLAIGVDRHFHAAAGNYAALEPQIMSDAKGPTTKVFARLLVDEMLEQRNKYFLHDFFTILDAQSGREQIAKEPIAPGIEQAGDFFFEPRSVRRAGMALPSERNGE